MQDKVLTAVPTFADPAAARPAEDAGAAGPAHAAARRTRRAQIALLESELAQAFVTAFEMRIGSLPGADAASPQKSAPHFKKSSISEFTLVPFNLRSKF